jgi:hypothetical protein
VFLQVAGKLEIRVVPKENVPRPAQTSPSNNAVEGESVEQNKEQQQPPPPERPKVKLERTKSILKQSSKERNENQEVHSPKREQITFAPDVNDPPEKTVKKRVSLEMDEATKKEPEEVKPEEEKKSKSPSPEKVKVEAEQKSEESSSSSSETEQKNSEKKEKVRLKSPPSGSNSHVNVPPTESLSRSNSQKAVSKPLEKIKNNLGHSASESSSSTQDKLEQNLKNARNALDKKNNETKQQDRVQCSPSVDLTTNPAVTFVSATSEPKYAR